MSSRTPAPQLLVSRSACLRVVDVSCDPVAKSLSSPCQPWDASSSSTPSSKAPSAVSCAAVSCSPHQVTVTGEDTHICLRDLDGLRIGDLIQIFPHENLNM